MDILNKEKNEFLHYGKASTPYRSAGKYKINQV